MSRHGRFGRAGVLLPWLMLALVGLYAGLAMAQTTNTQWGPLPFKDRAQEVRFEKLTKQLRCLVCQDESLFASQADLARQMRHMVFNQMEKGMSNEQIKQYLVARYSDYVLYKPPMRPSTWLLWFGPVVIIAFGAGIVIVTVRKRRAEAPTDVPEEDDEDW